MAIGERIKQARKSKGLTQKQLAEKLKVAPGTIQQYELGKRTPNFERILEIAEQLDVSANFLFGGTPELGHFHLTDEEMDGLGRDEAIEFWQNAGLPRHALVHDWDISELSANEVKALKATLNMLRQFATGDLQTDRSEKENHNGE